MTTCHHKIQLIGVWLLWCTTNVSASKWEQLGKSFLILLVCTLMTCLVLYFVCFISSVLVKNTKDKADESSRCVEGEVLSDLKF